MNSVRNTKRCQLNYKIFRINRRNLTLSIGKKIDEEKQRGLSEYVQVLEGLSVGRKRI